MMTYTLTLCLGMFFGLCGQVRTYDYQTRAECEAAKADFPQKAIGDGYAICAPKPLESKSRVVEQTGIGR